jgi:hypothetical protein
MMQSVREQMPRHLPYEFVIVDGGSTDGTLEWLMRQPDVQLLQHGELRGPFAPSATARGRHAGTTSSWRTMISTRTACARCPA